MDRDWPIAGRTAEVSFVVDAVRAGRGVVIAGATGVGKTRLAREACGELRGELAIETISATRASATIPLGVFAHLDEGRTSAFLTSLGAIRHALIARASESVKIVPFPLAISAECDAEPVPARRIIARR